MTIAAKCLLSAVPDALGRFGPFGGKYVPETLIEALKELEKAYKSAMADPVFLFEVDKWLQDFVGRPSRLFFAERLKIPAAENAI